MCMCVSVSVCAHAGGGGGFQFCEREGWGHQVAEKGTLIHDAGGSTRSGMVIIVVPLRSRGCHRIGGGVSRVFPESGRIA